MYRYRSHLAYVKSKVPSDDLLLWNVKDGWEPICNFLNVPIPNEPFPTMNMTGDKNKNNDFIQKHFMETKGGFLIDSWSSDWLRTPPIENLAKLMAECNEWIIYNTKKYFAIFIAVIGIVIALIRSF